MEVAAAHRVDQLYVALPLEEHAKLLQLIKSVSNECVDIKVVPDLVQYATIKAALEDLDGIPIISLNEVPLRGWNSMVKRVMDVVRRAPLLLLLLLARSSSPSRSLIKLRGRQGPGPAAPGAHDPRRQDVPDLQVPHHGRRGGEGHGPGLGAAPRTRGARRSASGCAASTSTSSRSS